MNLLVGLQQLITSPSGVFSLICLAVLTGLSLHLHDSMVMAFSAFFAVVPALLTIAEHRETMAQINQPTIPPKGML